MRRDLELRTIVVAALLAALTGCAYKIVVRPIPDANLVSLSENETVVFGRVLVYENGNLFPLGRIPPPFGHVFLTTPEYQPKCALVRQTYPPDHVSDGRIVCSADGDFQMIAPLGTYGLMIEYIPHRPMPFFHSRERMQIGPAVTLTLKTAQAATYVGTLKISIESTPKDFADQSQPYIVSNVEVIDSTERDYRPFLAQFENSNSLPVSSSLFVQSPDRKPTLNFLVEGIFSFPAPILR